MIILVVRYNAVWSGMSHRSIFWCTYFAHAPSQKRSSTLSSKGVNVYVKDNAAMIARSGFFRHFPAIWQTRQSGSSMLCKPILLQAGPLKFSRPKTVRRAEQIVLSYWSSHRRNRTPVSGHYGTRKGPLLRRQVSMSLTSFLAGAAAVIAAVYALIRYLGEDLDDSYNFQDRLSLWVCLCYHTIYIICHLHHLLACMTDWQGGT